MSDTSVIWPLLLIVMAMILFLLEIFVPSGGLLAVLASGALVSGVVMMFYKGETWGIVSTIGSLVGLLVVIGLGVKFLPSSPVFRLLTLNEQQEAFVPDRGQRANGQGRLAVGDRGRAVTELRPVGTCLINGERIECLAEQGTIAPGQEVLVVAVDGMHTKVRTTLS